MTKDEIAAKAREVICGLDIVLAAALTPEADFAHDLNLDSLDRIEMTMAIEEDFGVEISDEEGETILNFGQLVDFLNAKPFDGHLPA